MFDPVQLLNNTGDDQMLARQLGQTFVQTTPDLLSALQQAAETDDLTTVSGTAHTLKSSLDVLGATAERDLALRLEQLATGQPPTSSSEAADTCELTALNRQLQQQVRLVQAAVRQWLN